MAPNGQIGARNQLREREKLVPLSWLGGWGGPSAFGQSQIRPNRNSDPPRHGFQPYPSVHSGHFVKSKEIGPLMHNSSSGHHMQNSNSDPRMQNHKGGPHMQNNTNGPHIQNNTIGTRMQNNDSYPHMQNHKGGPYMQNDTCGPHMQNYNSDQLMQKHKGGPCKQNNNSGPHTQNNSSGPYIQNSTSSLDIQSIKSGPCMQNNVIGPRMQRNNSGPHIKINNSFLHIQNDTRGMQSVKSRPRMKTIKCPRKTVPLQHTNVSDSNIQKNTTSNHGSDVDSSTNYNPNDSCRRTVQHYARPSLAGTGVWLTSARSSQATKQDSSDLTVDQLRNQEKLTNQARKGDLNHRVYQSQLPKKQFLMNSKKKSNTFKLHLKMNLLEKQVIEKDKEIDELKDKTSELVKGNKHLVEVIKRRDLELDSNKVEMANMKSEIKCAQKEVLNCLKEKMVKFAGYEVLQNSSADLEETKIEIEQTKIDDTTDDVNEFENGSRLCFEIKSFLEFHRLAGKIGRSIESVLDTNNQSMATNWEVAKKDIESVVSTFQGNVVLLLDEVATVVKRKREMENCLTDIERNIRQKQEKIKKLAEEAEHLQKKVKKISKKDKVLPGKAFDLISQLKSTETDLLWLKKTHRKLGTEHKRILNKINTMASSLNLKV
eukprot:GFUD01042875.1.p1 GENE.GFUD01042875.1~~GFUD01042875.1.p1  ORF type:complete len:681 (+),score=134.65 GFUD01042875.1:85-2043(+)